MAQWVLNGILTVAYVGAAHLHWDASGWTMIMAYQAGLLGLLAIGWACE